MPHQSEYELTPEPADEPHPAEDQAAEQSNHAVAIDWALNEGLDETYQAAQEEAPIGRVVSVAGSQVMVLLKDFAAENASDPPIELQIGAVVKMHMPTSTVFGMVSGLSIPIPSQNSNESEMMMVELELVGEALKQKDTSKEMFQRGISFCPSLGNTVYTTTQEDLKQIYARPAVSSVRIGTIFQDQTLPAFIATDDLLGKHFAILGTTVKLSYNLFAVCTFS